jgi:hypothetical protein
MKPRELAPNHLTPRSGITGSHWWIVETTELGLAAFPGRTLAHQGAEVCRGLHLQVTKIRPANVTDLGDLLAIEQSRQELKDAQLSMAIAAGALPGARLRDPKTIATAP